MFRIGGEVLFVLVLVIANGVFAMSEIAVVSARKARLQQRAQEGDMRARQALDLANAPERFLSTVQIGITLVGILAGAFGGARIAEQRARYLERYPAVAPYSGAIGLGVVVVVITHLGRIPTAGDYFDSSAFRVEVMDMDGRRVDKVLVAPHPGPI